MMQFSPEMRLLLTAVVWRVESKVDVKSPPINSDAFDEDILFRLARKHNLLPWLWHYTNHFSLGSAEFRKSTAKALRQDEIASHLQTMEVILISSALTESKVPHLVFKGVSVKSLFYRDFVSTRYSDDIDILIAPADLSLASGVLEQHHYQLRDQCDIVKVKVFVERHSAWYRWRDLGFQKSKQGKEKIDLHWRIADEFTFPASVEYLLAKGQTLLLDGQNVPCLPFSLLFVYVCVHGYIDYFFRLRYLVDIYTAMQQPEFDLNEIRDIAISFGVVDKVDASIATAKAFFPQGEVVGRLEVAASQCHPFTQLVHRRYIESNGLPMRSHPHKALWTVKDKIRHLNNQIKFRSTKTSWFAPLKARCKYNEEMVSSWPEHISPWMWYPVALLKRLLK